MYHFNATKVDTGQQTERRPSKSPHVVRQECNEEEQRAANAMSLCERSIEVNSNGGFVWESNFYATQDLVSIHGANSLCQLSDIALNLIERMPSRITVLSHIEKSVGGIETYGDAVSRIQRIGSKGTPVLNLIPFYRKVWEMESLGEIISDENMVGEFLKPIFVAADVIKGKKGRITTFAMIPGWENSNIAMMLHDIATEKHITIQFLRPDFMDIPAGGNIFE